MIFKTNNQIKYDINAKTKISNKLSPLDFITIYSYNETSNWLT